MRSVRNGWIWLAVLGLTMTASPVRAADVEKLLPDDTEAVVTINFKQLLDSGLLKKNGLDMFKEKLKGDEKAQKTLKELGLDPFTDIHSFVTASAGDDKGLMILTGKFDVTKLQAAVEAVAKDKEDHFKIHQEKDGKDHSYKIYEVSKLDELIQLPPQLGDAAAGLSDAKIFIGMDKTAIFLSPDKTYVIDALAKAAGHKDSALKSKKLKELLKNADADKRTLSLAILASALAKDPNVAGDLKDTLDKLETITGGITVGDTIKTDIILGAKSDDAAKELQKSIDSGLASVTAIVGLLAGQNKEAAPLMDIIKTIKVKAKDKTVSINSTLDEDLLAKVGEAIAELAKKFHGGGQ